MSGPQHGLIGEFDEPIRLPETEIDDETFDEEKKKARYTKTPEFKKLRTYIEGRILFYQGFMPDGRTVDATPVTAEDWRIANAVIRELRAILNDYDRASETVRNERR